MKYQTGRILSLIFLILMVISASIAHAQLANPQETLKQYIADLQKNPNDNALREKIIKLVQEIKPAPAIPEEARQHFVMAQTFQKKAKDAKGYELAMSEYREALLIAPWWPEAYNNMGILLELAGKYDEAIRALKFYLLTNPKDARDAQDKIYAIEAAKKLALQEEIAKQKAAEQEKKAKEPSFVGTWYHSENPWYDITLYKNSYGQVLAKQPNLSYLREGNFAWTITNIRISGRNIKFRISLSIPGFRSFQGTDDYDLTLSEDEQTMVGRLESYWSSHGRRSESVIFSRR